MTRIKICGLFRPQDVQAVNEARPDWAGFIVDFPKSHRSVSAGELRELAKLLDPRIPAVGVFVDAPLEMVAELLADGTIQVAQLHGSENASYITELRSIAPKAAQIWKAFRVTEESIGEIASCPADLLVLDSGQGSGKTFDWNFAKGMERPFLLAGGLTPKNIPDAIAALAPYGLDISSGVETEKKKDAQKIREAVAAAREDAQRVE